MPDLIQRLENADKGVVPDQHLFRDAIDDIRQLRDALNRARLGFFNGQNRELIGPLATAHQDWIDAALLRSYETKR